MMGLQQWKPVNGRLVMKVVHKGNANILIDADDHWLWRICVRDDELKKNNEYTAKNVDYIMNVAKPLLGDMLCEISITHVPTEKISHLLQLYVSNLNDDVTTVIKLPNLIPRSYQCHVVDHFTKLHFSDNMKGIVWEFKPKWLWSDLDICRNCTHNRLKEREISYCYSMLLMEDKVAHLITEIFSKACVPPQFIEDVCNYLKQDNTVLRKLYRVQEQAGRHIPSLKSLKSIDDVSDDLCLSMMLKDVTCFLQWEGDKPISAKIVDVDMKPKTKWQHWVKTQSEVESIPDGVLH